MGNILDFLKNIKNARYGMDVRDSIHDAIQQCYYDGKAGTIDLEARQGLENKATKKELAVERARIDNFVSLKEGSTTGDAELADLKVGDDGKLYPSAGTAVRQRMAVRNVKSSKFTEVPGVVLSMMKSVQKWLDEHPEATTTVQDASLGVEKLTNEAKLHLVKDYVTPEMFGAKGDGVTDDTEAFLLALQHKFILINGSKKYLITSTLKPLQNSFILGTAGTNKFMSITKDNGYILYNGNDALFDLSNASIKLENLTLHGPGKSTETIGIFNARYDCVINECTIYRFGTGMEHPEASTQVVNTKVQECGIGINKPSDFKCMNTHVQCCRDGVIIPSGYGSAHFVNCKFDWNDGMGVDIEAGSARNLITNCYFDRNGRYGLYMAGSFNNVVSNCVFWRNFHRTTDPQYQIMMMYCERCILSNIALNIGGLGNDDDNITTPYPMGAIRLKANERCIVSNVTIDAVEKTYIVREENDETKVSNIYDNGHSTTISSEYYRISYRENGAYYLLFNQTVLTEIPGGEWVTLGVLPYGKPPRNSKSCVYINEINAHAYFRYLPETKEIQIKCKLPIPVGTYLEHEWIISA